MTTIVDFLSSPGGIAGWMLASAVAPNRFILAGFAIASLAAQYFG